MARKILVGILWMGGLLVASGWGGGNTAVLAQDGAPPLVWPASSGDGQQTSVPTTLAAKALRLPSSPPVLVTESGFVAASVDFKQPLDGISSVCHVFYFAAANPVDIGDWFEMHPDITNLGYAVGFVNIDQPPVTQRQICFNPSEFPLYADGQNTMFLFMSTGSVLLSGAVVKIEFKGELVWRSVYLPLVARGE